jgi:branched-chain amino acid transport system substrate-binding protein
MLGTIASDSGIWERRSLKWTFQAFPSSDYDHEAFLTVAEAAEAQKITIVHEDAGFSVSAAQWAEGEAQSKGMEVQLLSYPSDNQDFSSIVTKTKDFAPDALSMGGYYEPSIQLTNEMVAQDFNVDLYHFIQAADGVTKEALGDNVEGIMGRSSWEPQQDTPGNEEFTAGYEEMFGREPSYHSAAAYGAGEVAKAALEAGGGDSEAVREFLANETVETVGGTYQVNDKGQQEGLKYVGIQWLDGEKQVIWPDDVKTADVVVPKPEWN